MIDNYVSALRQDDKCTIRYPRFITQDFPGIGSKVDAVFENLFCNEYGKTIVILLHALVHKAFSTIFALAETFADKANVPSYRLPLLLRWSKAE